MSENLLDLIGYHEKWHGNVQKNKRKKYRYNQNDFLIKEIFERIGVEKGVFLEFGAIDGIKGSNSRLLYDCGWDKGILIECEDKKFIQLKENYKNNENIHTVQSLVDDKENKLDDIIEKTGIDHIDFCSIDIDGLDLKVFKAIDKYLPDVVCIEGGQCLDPFEDEISDDIAKNNIQQSLETYRKVFEKKGYTLIASYQDNIFVKKEYDNLFDVKDKSTLQFYIEGILAYPRIPWLIQQCVIHKIQNKILGYIVSEMDIRNILSVSQSDTATKSKWIDDNYKTIVEKCNTLLENEGVL